MAISLPSNFTLKALENSEDLVVLVDIYASGAPTLRFATRSENVDCVTAFKQYLSGVVDMGQVKTLWQWDEDNCVSRTAPTITMTDYSSPTGDSVVNSLDTNLYSGQPIVVRVGYASQALAQYVVVFSGICEELVIEEAQLVAKCKFATDRDVDISGSLIDKPNEKIGATSTSGSGIIIPDESNGKRLVIPFGSHWCAPALNYDVQANGTTYFATYDASWWSWLLVSHYATPTARFRHNLRQSKNCVYLYQDDWLVPIYSSGYHGDDIFVVSADTRISHGGASVKGIQFKNQTENEYNILDDMTVFVEVPMRIDVRSLESGQFDAYTSISGGESSWANIFDGDASVYADFSFVNSPIGDAPWAKHGVYILASRNIRHDSRCAVRPSRLIHVPSATSGDWSTLLLGRYQLQSEPGGCGNSYSTAIYLTFINTDNKSTAQKYGRGTSAHHYNYYSKLLTRNWDANWHVIDFAADEVALYGVGDGGNAVNQPGLGEVPFIRRVSYDKLELLVATWKIWINKNYYNPVGTYVIRVWDYALHTFDQIPIPVGDYIYLEADGIKITDGSLLLSKPTGTTGNYMPQRPLEYAECILRAKGGAVVDPLNGDTINQAEWGAAYTKFNAFFADKRTGSGFVITDERKLLDHLKETNAYEPFVVWLDDRGVWRLFHWRKTLAEIVANETIHTLDFNDIESNGWELGLTPIDKICAEIKSCETDFCGPRKECVVKRSWRLPDTADPVAYSYSFWDATNSLANNKYFLERLEKKLTSSPVVDTVSYSGKYYGCIRSCKNKTPDGTIDPWVSKYWVPLAGYNSTDWGHTPSAWSSGTEYRGEDAENRAIAEFRLNMFGNRKRRFRFSTRRPQYLKHEIGDYIQFANVPTSCYGLQLKGFGGNEDDDYQTVNGQAAYYVFVVTGVAKRFGRTEITGIQCVDLGAYRALDNLTQHM